MPTVLGQNDLVGIHSSQEQPVERYRGSARGEWGRFGGGFCESYWAGPEHGGRGSMESAEVQIVAKGLFDWSEALYAWTRNPWIPR